MRRSHKHQDPALTQLYAALTAPASADELAGEPQVLGTYQAVSWRQETRWRRPAVLAGKLGIATVAGVLGLSGVATAAYTGSLPDSLQDVAHKTINAPAAHPPTQAVGPDATGSAAYGLCQAFAKEKDHPGKPTAAPSHEPQGQGKAKSHGKGKGLTNSHDASQDAGQDRGQSKEKSVAYRNLVRAAGGEDKVAAYCASVPKPSGEPESSEAPEDSGKPTTTPTHPTAKPTGTPGHGRPTSLPAPAQSHPTGEHTAHPTGSPHS